MIRLQHLICNNIANKTKKLLQKNPMISYGLQGSYKIDESYGQMIKQHLRSCENKRSQSTSKSINHSNMLKTGLYYVKSF